MPLNKRLVECDDDEDQLYGVLAALMLTLPAAVRDTKPADVLRANGYCHRSAMETLRVSDLEEMGVLRGHASMMMGLLRPGGDPPPTPKPAARNETSSEPVRMNGRYMRCRAFPDVVSGGTPARRPWKAFIMAFTVVLRAIGVPLPVPDVVLDVALTPMRAYEPVDPDASGMV